MAAKTVVGGSNISASQLKDLFRQIDDGSIRRQHLQALLEHCNPFPPIANRWKIWKTIKLGTGLKTADDFRQAFNDNGQMVLDDRAINALLSPGFTVSKTEVEVDLVNISAYELGFRGFTHPLEEVYLGAIALGFELCPAEVCPQLLLQCPELMRLNAPFIHIGMEPLLERDTGYPLGFTLMYGQEHNALLLGEVVWLGNNCIPHERLVLVRPRK